MSDPERRCETCGAFARVREDAALGKVGECALEVFVPPIRATATCSRWRAKGAPAPPPPPRVAGEPRRRAFASPTPVAPIRRGDPAPGQPTAPLRASSSLPSEIDIDMTPDEFRRVLREVLQEEMGLGDAELGGRWQGGEIVLKPGKDGTQEKRIPLEAFFHKIVMVRDKLRVLEQKINANPALSDEDKVQLQQYVTGCYGSLTTFNVLFADKRDQFVGQGRDEG